MRIALALLLVLLPSLVQAQYTTASKWEWSAPANSIDIADAQAAVYKVYIGSSTVGLVLANVTCGPPKPTHTVATCTAPVTAAQLPLINVRTLTAALTATAVGTPESGPSGPFVVNLGLVAPGPFGLVP